MITKSGEMIPTVLLKVYGVLYDFYSLENIHKLYTALIISGVWSTTCPFCFINGCSMKSSINSHISKSACGEGEGEGKNKEYQND